MKYVPIIIGIIVLIILIGLVVAFVPRTGSSVAYNTPGCTTSAQVCPTQTVAAVGTPVYQASILNTTAQPAPIQTIPVAAVNTVNMAYPVGNTYAVVPATPIVPVVWYTAPSQRYTYLYGTNYTAPTAYTSSYNYQYSYPYAYSNTTVYPGSSQTYQYNTPGYSGYSNYQYTGSVMNSGGQWYQ